MALIRGQSAATTYVDQTECLEHCLHQFTKTETIRLMEKSTTAGFRRDNYFDASLRSLLHACEDNIQNGPITDITPASFGVMTVSCRGSCTVFSFHASPQRDSGRSPELDAHPGV